MPVPNPATTDGVASVAAAVTAAATAAAATAAAATAAAAINAARPALHPPDNKGDTSRRPPPPYLSPYECM